MSSSTKPKTKTPRKINAKKIVRRIDESTISIKNKKEKVCTEEKLDFVGFESDDLSCKIKNTYITLQNILRNNVETIIEKQKYGNAYDSDDEEMEDMLHLTKEQYLSNLKISKIKDPVPNLNSNLVSDVMTEKDGKLDDPGGKRRKWCLISNSEFSKPVSYRNFDSISEGVINTPLSLLVNSNEIASHNKTTDILLSPLISSYKNKTTRKAAAVNRLSQSAESSKIDSLLNDSANHISPSSVNKNSPGKTKKNLKVSNSDDFVSPLKGPISQLPSSETTVIKISPKKLRIQLIKLPSADINISVGNATDITKSLHSDSDKYNKLTFSHSKKYARSTDDKKIDPCKEMSLKDRQSLQLKNSENFDAANKINFEGNKLLENCENKLTDLKEENSNGKTEPDYHFMDSKYDLAINRVSRSDEMFKIPGLSYIIGIKPDSSSLKASYDCVICNFENASVTFSGPEMKSHVQSRTHVINVMLVENPALYDQYSNDLQISTKTLLNEILEYEAKQLPQKIVSATLTTYSEQKEKVISQLRISLSHHLVKQEEALKDEKIPLHVTSILKKYKNLTSRNNVSKVSTMVKIPLDKKDVDSEEKLCSKVGGQDIMASKSTNDDSIKKLFIPAKGFDCDFSGGDWSLNSSQVLLNSHDNIIKEDGLSTAKLSEEKNSLHEKAVKNVLDNIYDDSILKFKDFSGGKVNRTVNEAVEKSTLETKRGKYEQVVIIGDERYVPYLFILQKQPGVSFYSQDHFQIEDLEKFVSKDVKNSPKSTLYLFVIGIHSIARFNRSKVCLDAACRDPLDALQLSCALRKASISTQKSIDDLRSAMKNIKAILPIGSSIAILPPLPITLHDSRNHHSLHKSYKMYPLFKLVNFENDLSRWYPEWLDKMFKISRSSIADLSEEFNCLNELDKLNSENYKTYKPMTHDIKVENASYHLWKRCVHNIVFSTVKDLAKNLGSSVSAVKVENSHNLKTKDSPLKNYESHPKGLSSIDVKPRNSFKKLIEYDHLVFIGNGNSLKLIPDIKFCRYSQWHFDYISQSSSNLISRLKVLERESYKKVLFIILSDVSMIGLEETNPECLVKKCEHLLTYTKTSNHSASVMSMIKSVVDSVKKVIYDIEKYGRFELKVFVAPFTPRIYILISNIIIFHSKMHATFKDQVFIHFLRGSTKKVWEDLLNRFSTEWKTMALNVPHTDTWEKTQIRKIISESNANYSILWKDLSAEIFANDYSAMPVWKHCIISLAKCAWNKSFEFVRKVVEDRSGSAPSSQMHKSNFVTGGPQSNDNVSLEKENESSGTAKSVSFSTSSLSTKFPPLPPTIPPFQANYHPLPFIPSFPHSVPPSTIINNVKINPNRPNTKDYCMSIPLPPSLTYPPHISGSYHPPNPLLTKIGQATDAYLNQGSPSHSNFGNASEKISDSQNVELDITSKTNMNRDHDEIIQFARNIQNNSKVANLSSHSSMFNNVFIVGPRGLINPLLECNVKSTMIYHNFASFEDCDIQTLLYQMGDLQQKSVCCLVFDFSVIATKLIMSSGCAQQSCQQPIFVVALKSEPRPTESKKIEQLIHNQIQVISKFIRKLSQHIPVIILPLWPTRIYCEETCPNHYNSHTISNLGFPVVHGSKDVWKIAIQTLIPSWNTLMELTNRNYDSCNYISSYIGSKPKTFIILENISDFMLHWTELDLWKAFTETLLLSLVPMKSTGTFCGSNRSNSFSKFEKVDVTVTHVSSAIPPKFFEELFYSADRNVFILPDKDKYTLKGMTPGKANLLVKRLNRYRVGDTVLFAHVLVDVHRKHPVDYDYSEFNLLQSLYISSIFEKVYKKWRLEIINNLKRKVNDVLDFVKFKTVPCDKGDLCRDHKICPHYHNSLDIRRNPCEIIYSDTLCMQQRRNDGLCHNGKTCPLSHNVYEIKFHPSNYQIKICPSESTSEACNNIDLCNFAHKDSPELFYTNDWEDLTIIGPDHALNFFGGAIRAVRKIEDSYRPYSKVLLISPSKEFLDIAVQATANLSKSYGLMTGSLDENIGYQDYFQVLVGSPNIFSQLNANNFLEKKGAIIIDDIQSILENERQREEMRQFLHAISHSRNVVLNKVFVCVTFDPRSTSLLSDVSGLKLKLVQDLQTDLHLMTPSVGHNSSQWVPTPEMTSSQDIKSSSLSFGNWMSGSEGADRNWASSSYQDSHSRNKFSDISYSQHKRSRSRSTSPTHSKRQRKGDTTITSSASGQSIIETDIPNLDVENDLSKRFGKKLFEEYSLALEAIRQGFEKEFVKYSISPQIYPNYETYYESFTAMYNMQHVGRPPQHKEKLWKLFWKSKFDDIKKEDWLLKEKVLREEFEEKLRKYSASLQHIVERGNTFSFVGALALIENTCDDVGFLGPSVKAIVQSCRNLGTSTKESYKMFTEPENVMLVNMVLEKLKSLAISSTGNNTILYNKAIDWIPKLLEVAKRGPEEIAYSSIENLNIDLNAIAKASVGKGSKFALDLIKTAISYEGITNPPKELINDLFLKVCAIHFTLSID